LSSIEEGNLKLKEGEFENAKNIFSSLLDENPEDIELISGFYISSYWDNRLDIILSFKEGRERGTKLVQMFDEFEASFLKRALSKNQSYLAITYCVLSEASNHFRLAYQREGVSSLDKKILVDLSICLIKTGDYKNAIEIIEYSKIYSDSSSSLIFFEAECFYHLGEIKKSLLYFREGLLYDPELLRLDIIRSEPLHSVIQVLAKQFKNEVELKEYLPVYCLEKNLLPELRAYTRDDLLLLQSEMERLVVSLKEDKPDYKFKLSCRILQLGLTILDSNQSRFQPEITRHAIKIIKEIDPKILEKREANILNQKEGAKHEPRRS
jgi:tetratricopeptide (TPR) repeat protein